jgi:kynureninase
MFKNQFIIPKNSIYLCGHSLGPLPKLAHKTLNKAIQNWGNAGVKAWNEHNWIDLPKITALKIANIIQAKPEEVIVCDSTSVNLYKALKCALLLNNCRKIILTTEDIFPADLYIAEGISQFNPDITIRTISISSLEQNMSQETAVILLSHVNYRDASILDMNKITALAHELGIFVIWDLSHSVGIIPIDLTKDKVDFAVGCTYKYLNGGPGSPAFIYVNTKHLSISKSPIFGWMGHKKPFDFSAEYVAEKNISQFMGGTPCILSLSALHGALEIYDNFELKKLYQQAQVYSDYLIQELKKIGLTIISPMQSHLRGGHVGFTHPNGYGLSRALLENNIIVDYRSPDLIRICVNPLYINISDLNAFLKVLKKILAKKLYLNPKFNEILKVT